MANAVTVSTDRLLSALKRAATRLLARADLKIRSMTKGLLVLLAMGIFGAALTFAALAAIGSKMPGWLIEEIQYYILSGNRSVELSIDYLVNWGIVEVLRSSLKTMMLFATGLVVVLIVARMVMRSVRMLPWILGATTGRTELPRIRLTRPLRVSADDPSQGYQHRFDMLVDLVLSRPADTNPVIGCLSAIVPLMLRAAKESVEAAESEINTDDMARVLTRAARKCDKRIRRIELREVAYAMVHAKTGDVMFTQNLPTSVA